MNAFTPKTKPKKSPEDKIIERASDFISSRGSTEAILKDNEIIASSNQHFCLTSKGVEQVNQERIERMYRNMGRIRIKTFGPCLKEEEEVDTKETEHFLKIHESLAKIDSMESLK